MAQWEVSSMIPAQFEYFSPATLPEALTLLQTYGEAAQILSGGQSLIPLMKLRLASPAYLIDINRIPGLDRIEERDGYLHIGALTREADLEASQLLRTKYPMVVDTSAVIADPLVRNLATLGGNLAHADPANDHPATMLALEAEVIATGPDGERTIPITEFFSGYFTTVLHHTEILTAIRIPIAAERSGGAYVKLERKVGDFAIVGVAAHVTLDAAGACGRAGIGLTNVGPVPLKAQQAEAFLRGTGLDPETIKHAALLAADASAPEADLRGPADYKRDLVRVLTARALTHAVRRAAGAVA
jgi:aerobic carbon-monoxide dehydrogenase medium subunit